MTKKSTQKKPPDFHYDYVGNVVSPGSIVAFYAPNYRQMTHGTVVKITPQKVKVEYRIPNSKFLHTYTVEPKNVILV